MKLNPQDLVVSSFDTSLEPDALALPVRPTTATDPTAETWCYICPEETQNCW